MCLFGTGGGSSAPIRNVAERTDANAVPNTNTPQQNEDQLSSREVGGPPRKGGASSGPGKSSRNDRAY